MWSPPSYLFTVVHARCPACVSDTPRFHGLCDMVGLALLLVSVFRFVSVLHGSLWLRNETPGEPGEAHVLVMMLRHGLELVLRPGRHGVHLAIFIPHEVEVTHVDCDRLGPNA